MSTASKQGSDSDSEPDKPKSRRLAQAGGSRCAPALAPDWYLITPWLASRNTFPPAHVNSTAVRVRKDFAGCKALAKSELGITAMVQLWSFAAQVTEVASADE